MEKLKDKRGTEKIVSLNMENIKKTVKQEEKKY